MTRRERTEPRANRFVVLTSIGLLFTAFLAIMSPTSAHADGNGGGCSVNDPTCTVGVGSPGQPGNPGSSGGGNGGGPVTIGCHNTNPESGCNPCPPNVDLYKMPDPQACMAWEHNLFCSELNPTGLSYAAWENTLRLENCWKNPYVAGSAAVAAQSALASISFPSPSGDRSPRTSLLYRGLPFTYVNLFTFYWTDPGSWRTLSATARDKNQSATVTATPMALNFDPGNGASGESCGGPGRPWQASDGNAPPTDGACAYQYRTVTSSPITSTQTLVWALAWKVSGNVPGLPATFSTSTTGQLQVLQVQVVNR